jgi:hypothetical protein
LKMSATFIGKIEKENEVVWHVNAFDR